MGKRTESLRVDEEVVQENADSALKESIEQRYWDARQKSTEDLAEKTIVLLGMTLEDADFGAKVQEAIPVIDGIVGIAEHTLGLRTTKMLGSLGRGRSVR